METKEITQTGNFTELTTSITTITDQDYLLKLAFEHENIIVRLIALKKLIDIRKANQEDYKQLVMSFVEVKSNESILHLVSEYVSDNDVLTLLCNDNNHYKAATVATHRIKDLHQFNKLVKYNCENYVNVISFVNLPYSLFEIATGDFPEMVQSAAMDRLCALPDKFSLYNQLFEENYIGELVLEIAKVNSYS